MKCKVLLVGEGPSDIGDLAVQPAYREGREGFLQPLLRSMAGEDVELEFEGRKLVHLPKEPRTMRRAGEFQAENARRALALASALEASALVLAFDADKTPGARAKRLERRKRLRELRASAEDGFAHTRAHDADAPAIQTAIAIPCRMIEAWALGDREALASLLDVPAHALDYDAPEELWGDEHDPASDHPKRVWRRVTEERVDFSEIGAAASPSTLERTCPDSFPPFAKDVDHALRGCSERSRPEAGTGRRRRGRSRSRR
jgi:hypothetical protein